MNNNTNNNNSFAADILGIDINDEQKAMELDNIINELTEQSTTEEDINDDFGDDLGSEYTPIQKAAMQKAAKEKNVFYCDCFIHDEDGETIEVAYSEFDTVVYFKDDLIN